jgi:hypothetical protein
MERDLLVFFTDVLKGLGWERLRPQDISVCVLEDQLRADTARGESAVFQGHILHGWRDVVEHMLCKFAAAASCAGVLEPCSPALKCLSHCIARAAMAAAVQVREHLRVSMEPDAAHIRQCWNTIVTVLAGVAVGLVVLAHAVLMSRSGSAACLQALFLSNVPL